MELATEQDLEQRRVVKLPAAARTLNVSRRKLDEIIASTGTPIVQLGPKSRGIFLAHFDDLIRACVRVA